MSNVGVIFCAWQCADLLPASLTPWVEAKRGALGGHDFHICAVSVPFEGFPQEETRDNTRYKLGALANYGEIDHVVVSDKPMKETEARGKALKWLVAQGCELTIMVDSDEFWSPEQIVAALAFVEANPWTTWFRVCYKQLVFTHDQWLKEPFTPPRIHRTRTGAYRAHSFSGDNDVLYGGTITRDLKPQDQFASMTVPQAAVWVRHDTWTSSPRAKAKTIYQALRWDPPNGAGCSFRWDEERGLVWNEAHFALTGQPLPEVVRE